MNILFVGMRFNNYELKIKEEFEKQGHSVDLIYDKPKSYIVPAKFLSKNFIQKKNYEYQERNLKKINNRNYDIVFIIVGRNLSDSFLKTVKKENTKIVLYLWDDVARVENFELLQKYSDKIISFDKEDCTKYGFTFLPLFYLNDFYQEISDSPKKYDIYGVYWNHSDRLRIINSIIKQSCEKSLFFYIAVGRIFFLRTLLRKEAAIHFSFRSMPYRENVENMKDAKAILDIQFPSQHGLTIRTIEALGSGCKVITTNESVKQYDFYNPQNILIIEREHPVVDWNVLDSPYQRIDENIRRKYSVTNWVKSVLKIQKNC
ncbi:MAG: hypothetical protein SPK10_08025 [Treponema sp.]|nr:hypothetical protein [Treponema sp.]